MNSISQPRRPHFEAIGLLLQGGQLFGKGGALELARESVLKDARRGDIVSIMMMANVHYTIAGNLSKGWLGNKIWAAYHFLVAKELATRAFYFEFKKNNLEFAVGLLDVRLHGDKNLNGPLSYGDVHILMSCYAQWINQAKRRLRMDSSYEREIVESCHRTIMRGAPENLKILSLMVMYGLHGVSEQEKGPLRQELETFIDERHREVFSNRVDRGLVQTFCRVARAIGEYELAETVAELHNMGDQVTKAKKTH